MQVFVELGDKEYFILSGYDYDTVRRNPRHRECLQITAGLLSICYMVWFEQVDPTSKKFDIFNYDQLFVDEIKIIKAAFWNLHSSWWIWRFDKEGGGQ